MATADLLKLKVTDFSAAVGSVFEMQVPPTKGARAATTSIPLTLTKAEPNGMKPQSSTKPGEIVRDSEGFALEFTTPEGHGLPQGIYTLNHPKLGAMDIFLVPSGPFPGGFGYHTSFC